MKVVGIISRAVATIVFVLLIAPVAAHLIGRAAYFVGVLLWEGPSWMNCVGAMTWIRMCWLETQIQTINQFQQRNAGVPYPSGYYASFILLMRAVRTNHLEKETPSCQQTQ